MANITKEERERRRLAALAAGESPPADDDNEPETETASPPQNTTVPQPPAPPQPGPFDVSKEDLEHFKKHVLEEEKQRSRDAVEQAAKDAEKIARDRILTDPLVKALLADPGNVGHRQAFLNKFGPSLVKPPKPAPTPFGIKDPELMRWYCKHEPAKFIEIYGEGTSQMVKDLLPLAKTAVAAKP